MDVPLWAALLIGLGGGLIATFARISYERTAELRNRMIQAADDFSTSVFRALSAMRDSLDAAADTEEPITTGTVTGPLFREPLQSGLDEVGKRIDEVHERLARVHLLIGVPEDSAAGESADRILRKLRECNSSLNDWPNSITDHRTKKEYNASFDAAAKEHDRFNRAARREIRAGVFVTLVRWVRWGWTRT
jgi:hypothetical protein